MSLPFFATDSEEVRYRALCRDWIPVDGDSVFVLVLKRSCLKTILWGLSIRNSTLSGAYLQDSDSIFALFLYQGSQEELIICYRTPLIPLMWNKGVLLWLWHEKVLDAEPQVSVRPCVRTLWCSDVYLWSFSNALSCMATCGEPRPTKNVRWTRTRSLTYSYTHWHTHTRKHMREITFWYLYSPEHIFWITL